MLKTPEKIRELQRKLYRKAKQEKEYRFYLLYDKIYRLDRLTHKARIVSCNWDSYRLKQSLKEKGKQGRTTHANNGL